VCGSVGAVLVLQMLLKVRDLEVGVRSVRATTGRVCVREGGSQCVGVLLFLLLFLCFRCSKKYAIWE
jgi:hypothetical protein